MTCLGADAAGVVAPERVGVEALVAGRIVAADVVAGAAGAGRDVQQPVVARELTAEPGIGADVAGARQIGIGLLTRTPSANGAPVRSSSHRSTRPNATP